MSLFLVSCEKSSYVGLDYSVQQNEPGTPKKDVKGETPEEETSEEEILEEPTPETENVSDEFEKVLPPEWGIIMGADISAVPADDEDKDMDKKCLLIRTNLGAVTVVFPREEVLSEVEDIVAGNFTKGNFDESYNSAIYVDDNWCPASAVDSKDRLEYLVDGVVKRNLRYTTLRKWDWQNKDDYFSTKVSGYDFKVEDGVLNIYYGGEQVLQIR
ncbi:MAG: hypothetical protein IJ019_04770 [Alphaproteobacteria bacterium]|nr:hypothetical protein [Alphaproteobacteria bacterium]